VLLGYRPVWSPDIGFYLDIGRQIAASAAIPFEDSLTFTRAGTQVLFYPWLFCLVSWWLYGAGGALAIVVARIALHLASVGLLLLRCRRRDGAFGLPAWLLLLLFSLGSGWEYRPHLFSWLFLGLVLLILEEHERGRSRLLWLLPPVVALWANLHSLFVLGPVVIGLHLIGGWLSHRRFDRRLLAVAIVSLLACLVTPYFRTVALFPLMQLEILRGGLINSDVVGTAEFLSPFRLDHYDAAGRSVWWQPILFVHAYFALTLLAALFGRKRYRATDWLLHGAFAWILFQAMKNQGYYVIATLPAAVSGLAVLGERAGAALRGLSERLQGLGRPLGQAALVSLSLVVALQVASGYWYGLQRSPHRLGGGFNETVLPVRAAAFLAGEFPRPLRTLNNWDAGGYLRFATRWPVFIDGRNEVMGESFYREYLTFKRLKSFPAAMNRWNLEAALVPHTELPLWFHILREDPRWVFVYGDDRDAVFVKRSRLPAGSAWSPPRVGRDYETVSLNDADAILARAVALRMPSLVASLWSPQYEPQAELRRSLLYLRAGNPDAALGVGLAGLARTTFPAPELLATLGHAFYDLGDLDRAGVCFEGALRRLDDPLARERLDRVHASRPG
jgi:hypothetical protein